MQYYKKSILRLKTELFINLSLLVLTYLRFFANVKNKATLTILK